MAKIARYIFRPLSIVIFLISLAFTALTLYDTFVGDKPCPEFWPAPSRIIDVSDKALTRYLWGDDSSLTQKDYWGGLQKTLAILDEINPSVSDWVRDRRSKGKIRFARNLAEIAKYDYFTSELTINNSFFSGTEMRKVSWICHEYRHSRQNFGKISRYILSYACGGQGRPEIVENDAYLYEREAEAAMLPQRP